MEQSLLPSADGREEQPRCQNDISRFFWDTVEALCYGDECDSDYDEQNPLNARDHGAAAEEDHKMEADEIRGSTCPFGGEVASDVVPPDNKRDIPVPFHQQPTTEEVSPHTEQVQSDTTHYNEIAPLQCLDSRPVFLTEDTASEADVELQFDGTQKSSCRSSVVALDSSSQSKKTTTNSCEYPAEPRPSSRSCEPEARHVEFTEPIQESDEWRAQAFRALLVAQSAPRQEPPGRRANPSPISVPYGGARSSSNVPTSSSSSGAENQSSRTEARPPSFSAEQGRPSVSSPRGFSSGGITNKDLSQTTITPTEVSHPWAYLVRPRHLRRHEIDPQQVTNILPEDKYRPIPSAGYLFLKFSHSLFPHVRPTNGIPTEEIPFLELPSLEDAIAFRFDTEQIIQRTFAGMVEPVSQPAPESMAKKTRWTSCLFPRSLDGKCPVLYQVVAVISNALVLEAKDFFVFLPDRRELHCILLDRFAYNVESDKYGYDRQLVSERDFVWVYDLMPLLAALASPEDCLRRARMQRTAALDPDATFFFRVARFAFVTPPVWGELRYGFVLSATRRGTFINNYKMAFEGAPEAVTITQTLAHFSWKNVREGAMMKALCRQKSSCAVRFSEPPASVQARDKLCRYVKLFLPANPDEAVVPLEVHKLTPTEAAWLADRLADFDSYRTSRDTAVLTMAKVFRAASSALASYATADDDRRIHRVTATIPNLMDYPVRLEFLLSDMTSEAGWVRHRSAGVIVTDVSSFIRMEVDRVEQLREARQLRITLQAYAWTHQSVMRVTYQAGSVAGNSALLDVCVKLEKHASSAIPAYEAVTGMDLLNDIPADSLGRTILDIVYGAAEPQENASSLLVVDEAHIILNGRIVQLTDDQRQALAMGHTPFPIAGIQAAFGTGKTIVGSCIAAQQAKLGRKVIVTATTNAAVAQFTEAILSLDAFLDVPSFRYIAESIIFDETTISTEVDMHVVLKKLPDIYKGELSREDLAACKRFREGRSLFENHMRNRNRERYLTEQEREELILVERDVSELIDKVVRVMFEKLQPRIVAITTSSLLNATERQGIFNGYLDDFSLIICDEASLAPEPVFAAILSRFPKMRQIYIGDVHMLEPHISCSRHADVVKCGARSIMDVLSNSGTVPIAQLTTTFRAHPQLNSLPNRLFYGGTLRNGTLAAHRRMLLDIMHFPNAELPFIFIDVNGASTKAQSRSYYNVEEAEVCLALVNRLRRRGIASESICIVSFYKEQHRRLTDFARSSGVELSTVDAIQGREKDVVVLLTTRTNFSREGSEFLDDPRRINVALTRCRHGQFVLGHEPSLSVAPVWRSVITWARELDAVVSAESLENIFL